MARVKGRDVLLDLMDTVKALQAESAEQREQLEALHAQFDAMIASVDVMAGGQRRQEGLLGRMARLIAQMADNTSRRFEDIESRVQALEASE